MKQSLMTMFYIANAFEKEAELQEKIKKLSEERLSKIQSPESQLKEEKTTRAQFEDNLNKANEELQQLKGEKESIDRNYSEAVKKVKELMVLHNKSSKKISALEEEKN